MDQIEIEFKNRKVKCLRRIFNGCFRAIARTLKKEHDTFTKNGGTENEFNDLSVNFVAQIIYLLFLKNLENYNDFCHDKEMMTKLFGEYLELCFMVNMEEGEKH